MDTFTTHQQFFTNAAVIKLDLMGTYFVRFSSFSTVLSSASWRTLRHWWSVNGYLEKNGNAGSQCASLEAVCFCMCFHVLCFFRGASVRQIWIGGSIGDVFGNCCNCHVASRVNKILWEGKKIRDLFELLDLRTETKVGNILSFQGW